MKARVNGQHFVRSIALCGHALPMRSGVGRKGEIILRAVSGQLECSADNGIFTISASLPASVEAEGTISVPAEILTGFAAAVDDIEDVALTYESTNSELHLQSASFDPRIRCRSDVPPPLEVAESDVAVEIELEANQFLPGLRSVVFAASKDDHRPVMTGVQLSVQAGSVELLATDGHRMAWRRLEGIASTGVERSAVIPAATLEEALSAIEITGAPKITLAFDRDGRQVQLSSGPVKLVSRLLEGTLPRVDHLRGLTGRAVLIVMAHELANKVRATAVWARAGDHVIRVYGDQSPVLTASTRDVGDIRTSLSAKFSGGQSRAALNYTFLLDCCAASPDGTFEVHVIDEDSPVTIRHEGAASYEYVMMSVKLSDW